MTDAEILSFYDDLSAFGEATLEIHHIVYRVVVKLLS